MPPAVDPHGLQAFGAGGGLAFFPAIIGALRCQPQKQQGDQQQEAESHPAIGFVAASHGSTGQLVREADLTDLLSQGFAVVEVVSPGGPEGFLVGQDLVEGEPISADEVLAVMVTSEVHGSVDDPSSDAEWGADAFEVYGEGISAVAEPDFVVVGVELDLEGGLPVESRVTAEELDGELELFSQGALVFGSL